MGQLTANEIKNLTTPGRYVDGDGLILNVAAGRSKSWILRVRVEGGRRDIGLGSTKVLTLTEARTKAREYRRLIAQGIDPVAEKKREKVVIPTFRVAAEQVHAEHKASWKNGKHQVQWITTLETYAYHPMPRSAPPTPRLSANTAIQIMPVWWRRLSIRSTP